MLKTFYKNYENDVSYLALKSTRTIYTITSLNISNKIRNRISLVYSGNNH